MRFCCLHIGSQSRFKCPKGSKISPHTMHHASMTEDVREAWAIQKHPLETRGNQSGHLQQRWVPTFRQLSCAPKQDCQPSLQSTTGRNQVQELISGRCRWHYSHVPQHCREAWLVPISPHQRGAASPQGAFQLCAAVLNTCLSLHLTAIFR